MGGLSTLDVGFCPLVPVRAIREGEYCKTAKGRSDATELDSESEREALTDPSRGASRRWPRPELRPSAHPQLSAPEQDRRRGQSVPGRLSPERLTSANRLICLAACAGPQGSCDVAPCAAASAGCSARWSGSPTTTPRAIYARVGVDGLNRLAHRAGMLHFTANTVWGGCQVTARDQARSSSASGGCCRSSTAATR